MGPGHESHAQEGCWETLSPSCFRAQQAEVITRAGLGSSEGVQLGSRNRPGSGRWPGGEEGAG